MNRQLVTFREELRHGMVVRPHQKAFLIGFYDDIDDDWLECNRWFHNEWEKYEWLIKRAIAGYFPSPDDFMFMHRYEESLDYKADMGFRYEQLKLIYADELQPIFGTLHKRRKPQ